MAFACFDRETYLQKQKYIPVTGVSHPPFVITFFVATKEDCVSRVPFLDTPGVILLYQRAQKLTASLEAAARLGVGEAVRTPF